jgi:SAM-dependent methyltransferase
MICRHCGSDLRLTMVDLGTSPPSNSYLSADDLDRPEKWYPLRVLVCTECWLAQTADFVEREECFSSSYAYFSSCSTTWVEHARRYVEEVAGRYRLDAHSLVVEVAANDGYLLQHVTARGIPCYGIEPTASTARVAQAKGHDIVEEFFSRSLAVRLRQESGAVDLLVANNVLAHVPDINDFLQGVAVLLKPAGVATFEIPHLMELLQRNYFDTIYHEHFSYFSLHAAERIFRENGLVIFDVEELPTHGGSLRLHACKNKGAHVSRGHRMEAFLAKEKNAGLLEPDTYLKFAGRVELIKNKFLSFLLRGRSEGKSLAAYGAAAKGNTFLNYAGIKADLLPFVVDRSPAKIGKFLPGSRIPIIEEGELRRKEPLFIVILPWNLRDEISRQLEYSRRWGAKFVVALPQLEVF